MEMVPNRCFDNIKRYWRRRRYQRLEDAPEMKKKIKIAYFGGKKSQHLTFVSPSKLVGRFHKVYVDAMVRLSGDKTIENFAQKRVPKGHPAPMLLAAPNHEMVDTMRVVELYNRVVSIRQQLL